VDKRCKVTFGEYKGEEGVIERELEGGFYAGYVIKFDNGETSHLPYQYVEVIEGNDN
jgi:hypothetical protein